LTLAGRPTNWPLERLLATKLLLGGIGVALLLLRAVTGGTPTNLLLFCALALRLYLTPDVYVAARAKERQRQILADLPDALDQMTICMEAGLGFEAAMARAGQSNFGPLAQELVRTLQDVQVGIGLREALRSFAERNDVPDLRHF